MADDKEFERELKTAMRDFYLQNYQMTGLTARFGVPIQVRRDMKYFRGAGKKERRKLVLDLLHALAERDPDPYEDVSRDLYRSTVLLNLPRLLGYVAPPDLARRVIGDAEVRIEVIRRLYTHEL